MAKQVKQIEVGVKYKGYGFLNEYGEWTFVPEETGSRAGQKKLLSEGDGYSVYTTSKKLIVHLSVCKSGNKLEMIKAFFNMCNRLIQILKEYDF